MADQQYCLRWNNHQSTLISVFDSLQERGCMVDCTLAAEGQSLQAHKVVLSACSPYLEDLLSKHYDKHPILLLKDVKFEELKAMMDYMYRGEVNVAQDKLNTFLRAAESLQIKGLSDGGTDPPDSGGTTSTKRTAKGTPVSVRSNQLTVRKTNLDDSSSRDGSTSPSQRKRRRRRGSETSDIETSNVSDGKQSTAAAAPVSGPSETSPIVPASAPSDDNILSSITESAETENATDSGFSSAVPQEINNVIRDRDLIEPKTEYVEDDGQDLNLEDEDGLFRAGPSHARGTYEGDGDDDVYMTNQDSGANAQGPASGEVPNDSAAGGAGAGTGAKAPSQQQLRLAPFIRALPAAVSLSQPPNENKYVVTSSPSPLARARRISASSESTASSLTLGPLPIAELDLLSPRISPAWASPPSSPVLGSGQKRPVRRRLPFKNGFAENKGTVCATGAQDPAGDRGSVAAPAARDPAKDTDCVAAAAAQDPGGDKDTVEAAAARDPAKDTDCVAAAAAQDPGGDKDTVASAAAQYPAGVLLPVVESDSDEEVKRPSSFRRRRAISSSSSSAADISEGDESIDAGVEQEVATEDDAASNGSRGVQQVHRDDQSNLSVLIESDEDIMSTETLLLETSQAESVHSLSATKNDASVTPVPLSLPASSVARMPLVTCAATDTVIPPTNFSTAAAPQCKQCWVLLHRL